MPIWQVILIAIIAGIVMYGGILLYARLVNPSGGSGSTGESSETSF